MVGAGHSKWLEHIGMVLLMYTSTVVRPGDIKWSEHIGQCSCMHRSTVVGAGDFKWSEHTGIMILHMQEQCGQSRGIEMVGVLSCVPRPFNFPCSNHTASVHARALSCVLHPFNVPCSNHSASAYSGAPFLCAPTIYCLLLRPQHFCTCRSIFPVCSDHLIYPGLTTQLLHMHEHYPVCSNTLMCPGLTTMLLHMKEHHFCVLRPFNVPWSDHSAFAYEGAPFLCAPTI